MTALGLAQNVTGSGTAGTIPVFTGTSAIGNSVITQSGGNVGIGILTPAAALHVVGTNPSIRIDNYSNNGSDSPNFSFESARGSSTVPGATQSGDNIGQYAAAGYNGTAFPGSKVKVNFVATENWTPTANGTAISFQTTANTDTTVTRTERMRIDNTGNVGIGNFSSGAGPANLFTVNGVIQTTTGGVMFPDGSVQTQAFIPANCGADYAEAVNVTGDRTNYQPGDILVIDPQTPGKFLKSTQAYSTLVAGIYSTKPGFVGRLHPADPQTSASEVPMAMVGRVPTKVSAENGPIHVGDLLVSSSTLGYAMKGTDRSQMLGAVIGKALGSLDSGTGVIEVLVTLQ